MDAFRFRHAFRDRVTAGRELAAAVAALPHLVDPIVLALPRGGVPVAGEVALRISATLDVLVVRKLGAPGEEELALGAVATGGVEVLNDDLIWEVGPTHAELDVIRRRETDEVERRSTQYRGHRPWPSLAGRSVIVVDDGVATGATMLAAIAALRAQDPGEVIVAVPVAPEDACRRLRAAADRLICLRTPEPFLAIGLWYEDFRQVSDDEVRDVLDDAHRAAAGTP
jgi:putative phosphoribosyl transferase